MAYPVIANTSSGTNGTAATTSTTITYPSSISPGDLILLHLATYETSTVTNPSGWTLAYSISPQRQHHRIYTRVASSALSGIFSITHGNAITVWRCYRVPGPAAFLIGNRHSGGPSTSIYPPSTTLSSPLENGKDT